MNLNTLDKTPPWDWPEDAGRMILETLVNRSLPEAKRVKAANLAGEIVAMSDPLAEALLEILNNSQESVKLRSRAAISLGPALEEADIEDYDDSEYLPAISQPVFAKVKESLRALFSDVSVPKGVRRCILEASVRSPQPWHVEEVRRAYATADDEWRLTAVFCMNYIKGFEGQIVESLHSEDSLIRYHAVRAAGAWEIDAAWPDIAELVTSPDTEKELLLAAIETAAAIRPDETDIFDHLYDSKDEDIVEAVMEASESTYDDLEEDEDDQDEEEEV